MKWRIGIFDCWGALRRNSCLTTSLRDCELSVNIDKQQA